jgi:hypothetical protein
MMLLAVRRSPTWRNTINPAAMIASISPARRAAADQDGVR